MTALAVIPEHMKGRPGQFGPLPDASFKKGPYAGLAYDAFHGPVIPLEQATPFDLNTDGIGTPECAKFRRRFGLHHLSFNRELSNFYLRLARERDYADANRQLAKLDESLFLHGVCGRINLTHDDESLQIHAGVIARKLALLCPLARIPESDAFTCSITSDAIQLLLDYQLYPSDKVIAQLVKDYGPMPFRNRITDERFMLRRLRSTRVLLMADITRQMGLVCRVRQPYVSDYVVGLRKEQLNRNELMIDGLVCVNKDDRTDYAELRDMVDASVSNLSNRQAELISRVKGLAQIAVEDKHVGLFLTFTTPSRFHACGVDGKVNQNWLDAGKPSVHDGHSWLMEQFKLIRAQWAKHGVDPYGLRVAEPHHDGTPHWHLVLFVQPSKARQLREICRSVLLSDSPDEPGARKARFKCKVVNTKKYGPEAAIRYCLFYVSKNLQGATNRQADEAPQKSELMAARVDAWKSTYRIRQFSQIGAQFVTVWRELRKLRNPYSETDPMFADLCAGEWLALENLRRAADSGDWCAFVRAMGGVSVKRADQSLVAHYSVLQAMSKLTNDFQEAMTRYGDVARGQVRGLIWQRVFEKFADRRFVPTRFKNWTIENKRRFLRGVVKVMDGTVDIFDVMEQQEYYLALADEYFEKLQQYESQEFFYIDLVAGDVIEPEYFELTPLEFVSDELPLWLSGGGGAAAGPTEPLDLCQ